MMETERLSFIPISTEYAAMLLRDPQQLEEALCVAYSGPEVEGTWAEVLRQIVFPTAPSKTQEPQNLSETVAWLIHMRAEDTIIGTLEAFRAAFQTAWQFRYHVSPAYQHLGYEAEIETIMAQVPSLLA